MYENRVGGLIQMKTELYVCKASSAHFFDDPGEWSVHNHYGRKKASNFLVRNHEYGILTNIEAETWPSGCTSIYYTVLFSQNRFGQIRNLRTTKKHPEDYWVSQIFNFACFDETKL